MFAKYVLKHRGEERAVYNYGVDVAGVLNDGEVEFSLKSWDFKLLKVATGDIESRLGFRGLYLAPNLCEEILKSGCPKERRIAIG